MIQCHKSTPTKVGYQKFNSGIRILIILNLGIKPTKRINEVSKNIYPYMQFAFELCVMYHQQFLMDFSELKSWTVYDTIFITISELKPNRVNQLDLKPIGKNTWSPIIKINRRKKKVQLIIPPWEDIYLLACGWSIQVWGRKDACSAHTPDLAMVIITFGPRLIK